MLVSLSDLYLLKTLCSWSRMAVAFAIWSFASARLVVCSFREASVASLFSDMALTLAPSASILLSDAAMLASRVAFPVLQ